MFEPNTHLLRRAMLEGVARRNPDEVVAMVGRMRGRGHSYRKILRMFGPRPSCPSHLHPLYDRVELFASLEPVTREIPRIPS